MFIERHEGLEDAVIEAVEKQVPKKPIKIMTEYMKKTVAQLVTGAYSQMTIIAGAVKQ